jgi:tRNA A37 threonylcarbamoyladenosine dehydratase
MFISRTNILSVIDKEHLDYTNKNTDIKVSVHDFWNNHVRLMPNNLEVFGSKKTKESKQDSQSRLKSLGALYGIHVMTI